MGRKLKFNRDEALETTMHLFWENGYNGTSVQNIIDEIGIREDWKYVGEAHKLDVLMNELHKFAKDVWLVLAGTDLTKSLRR